MDCTTTNGTIPSSAMSTIAIIMTAHNRRDTTVASLRSLAASAAAVADLEYIVYLTDDGSTDGTAEAVSELALPIAIIQGTGDLYWNRGMVRSWSKAAEQRALFDGYLLLNDDTTLDQQALTVLLALGRLHNASAVIVGATRDPITGELTYGGVKRTSSWHPGRTTRLPMSETPQEADAFNANCVYVPAEVADAVGTLDPVFHHGMGDFDYGYRARKLGFNIVVAPNTIGTCAVNSVDGTWRDTALPYRRRLHALRSPKGLPFSEWREFLMRHGAPLPTLLAAAPWLSVAASSLLASGRKRSQGRENVL